MTYEECNIASYSVGITPTELNREERESNPLLDIVRCLDKYSHSLSFTHQPSQERPAGLSLKKRERGSLVSPHHNRWNFHRGPTNLKILPSLSEGRRTPSITVKLNGSWPYWAANQQPTLGTNRRSFWALSVYSRSSGGLRPPCHTPEPEI